jgi:hypothetical protein
MSSGSPGYRYVKLSLVTPHTVDNDVLRGGGQYEVRVYAFPAN